MKKCNRCGTEKAPADYYKNAKSKDGLLGICNTCVNNRQREYVAKNADAVAAGMRDYRTRNKESIRAAQLAYRERNKNYLRAYRRHKQTGFSAELFKETVDFQKGKCAICRRLLAEIPEHLVHADHCHKTGIPRGVLCSVCNTSLGQFGDDPRVLMRAVRYLQNPPVARLMGL